MMDEQLMHLIQLYETEKIELQRQLDDSLTEGDYLTAHYYSEGLYRLYSKLSTFQTFNDKLYSSKRFYQMMIERNQHLLEGENGQMKEFYQNQIKQNSRELEKLNEIPNQSQPQQSLTLLDESLQKLTEKKIKNLKLILHKKDNLLLQFDYSKKKVKVTMPRVKQLVKKQILQEDKLTFLQNIGFILNEKGTELILILSGDSEANLVQLKIILSKITFEIFFFRDFQNQSFIQFTEK